MRQSGRDEAGARRGDHRGSTSGGEALAGICRRSESRERMARQHPKHAPSVFPEKMSRTAKPAACRTIARPQSLRVLQREPHRIPIEKKAITWRKRPERNPSFAKCQCFCPHSRFEKPLQNSSPHGRSRFTATKNDRAPSPPCATRCCRSY